MARQEQDAFPATLPGIEVLLAIEHYHLLDVLSRVLWKLRKLSCEPPYLPDHSANNAPPLLVAGFWKRQFQIEHCRAPERPTQKVRKGRQPRTHKSCCRPREQAERLHRHPRSFVLHPLAHRRSLCVRLTPGCQRSSSAINFCG